MIKVQVPATTANLGPGFDCMGLALSLYGRFSFQTIEEGLKFEGVPLQFQNEDNLAIRSYRLAEKAASKSPAKGGLRLSIDSDIPVSRGLGSSASLIVAGILAANAACGYALSEHQILNLATVIEGHPDNVAPALLGGLTVSMMDNNQAFAIRCPISKSIRFCALIPDFELSTHLARSVLPKSVPFADAVFNASHAACLLPALEKGDIGLIRKALKDSLHQKYRAELIDQYGLIQDMMKEEVMFISGAGPTLMCIYQQEDFPERIARELADLNHQWKAVPLKTAIHGPSVTEVDDEL